MTFYEKIEKSSFNTEIVVVSLNNFQCQLRKPLYTRSLFLARVSRQWLRFSREEGEQEERMGEEEGDKMKAKDTGRKRSKKS